MAQEMETISSYLNINNYSYDNHTSGCILHSQQIPLCSKIYDLAGLGGAWRTRARVGRVETEVHLHQWLKEKYKNRRSVSMPA